MDDMGAKLESDRDYRKVTRSGEFGRSGSAPNLVPQGVHFFGGAGVIRASAIACKPPKVVVRRALIQ